MNKSQRKIAAEAELQNTKLKRFERLIGEWMTTGSHPYLPEVILRGKTSFEWILGGSFILMRSEIDDSRFPKGLALIGSDDDSDNAFMLYFDSRGFSRKYNVDLKDNIWKQWRDESEFKQKLVGEISNDNKTMHSKGEMSKDNGVTWEKDLELIYNKK